MNIKAILKRLKLQESSVSMVLGIIVIIVISYIVVNYFRNLDTGTTLPTGSTTEETGLGTKTHIVKEGETLWDIAEKEYGSGYNWVDIANENNLESPNAIEKDQVLTLPDITAKTPTIEVELPATKEATLEPEDAMTEKELTAPKTSIAGDSYTVVKGDTLWDIAVKAYGDGYKWVEIARKNKLANPDLIHPGNVFVLP